MLKINLSGQAQLILVAVLFVLIPMLFIIYSFIAQYAEIGKVSGNVQLGKFVVRVADHLDREISLTMNGIKTLSLSRQLQDRLDSPDALSRFLAESQKEVSGLSGLEYYPEGKPLPLEPQARQALDKAMVSGLPANSPIYLTAEKAPALVIAYPLKSPEGKVQGSLLGRVNVEQLLQRIKKRMGFSDALNLFLLTGSGELLFNLNKEPITNLGQLADPKEVPAIAMSNSGTFRYRYHEKSYLAGYYASRSIGELTSSQVSIMITAPEAAVERSKTKPYLLLLFGALAGAILLVYYGLTIRSSFYKKS